MIDTTDQFKTAMRQDGLTPPDVIEPGKWHKFPGYQKSAKNRAAWCYLFDDMRGGVFGDFSSGMESTWQASNSMPYTEAERQAHRDRIQAMQRQREADMAQRQTHAAHTASTRLMAAKPCTQHPYLDRKGIKPNGAKIEGDKLLIPMRTTDGKLHSLQTIGADGDKLFMPGGRVNGCYFWLC